MSKQKFPDYLKYREGYPDGTMPYHAGRVDRVKTGGMHNNAGTATEGSRISMLTSHTADELPLLNPTTKTLLSGLEQDLARSSWHSYIEGSNPQEIIAVLDRQRLHPEYCGEVPARLVVHKDLMTNEISCSPIETYMQHHPVFGFPLRPIPEVEEELYPGNIVPGDMVLAKPSAWTDDDNWAMGREANVALYSLFGTNEDSAIACETVRENFVSTRYTTIRLWVDNGQYLLPIHDGKVLPVIGQKIKHKGMIAVLRRRVKENNLIHRLKCKSKEERIGFDEAYFSEMDCTVVNVEVYRKHEKPKTDYCPRSHNAWLDALWNHNLEYYRSILELDEQFKRQYGTKYSQSPEWHIAVTEAVRCCEARPGKLTEPDPTHLDKASTGYFIEITTRALVIPQIGHKGTGRQGEKFVISQIRPKAGMPKDKWGRSAEFVFNPNASVNRNIASMVYEPYMVDTMFHLLRRMKKISDYEERKQYYLNGMALISQRSYSLMMSMPPDRLQKHLDEVLSDDCQRLDRVDEIGDISLTAYGLNDVRLSPYAPPRDRCTFIADNGKEEYTRAPVRVAGKTVFMLNKIGEYSSACAVPNRQITGIAERVNSQDKRKSQISLQSNRDTGAAEVRNFFAVLDQLTVMRHLKMGLSPQAIREQQTQIAEGAIMTNVNVDGFATRGSEILRAECETWGMELSDVPESPDELFVNMG